MVPDETTLYSKHDRISDLWQWLELVFELGSDLQDGVDWDRKWLVDLNAGKALFVWFNRFDNFVAVDVNMNGSVLDKNSFLKILGFSFSPKLDGDSYIVLLLKLALRK